MRPISVEARLLPWRNKGFRVLLAGPFRGIEYAAAIPGAILSVFFINRWGRQPDGSYLFTLFDDAAISKTYARTLASTGELVWFPGAERVEGISNLLWTLVMAVVHLVGFSGSFAALAISGIGLVVLVVHAIQAGRLAKRVLIGVSENQARLAAAITVFLSGTAYPLLFWTLRGFETGIIALLYVLLLHRALDVEGRRESDGSRSVILLSTVTLLLVGVRLDAVIVPAVAIGWLLYRRALSRRDVAWLAGVVGLGLSALLMWRYSYFGSIVPNTYFLKVSDAPTSLRLQRGLAVSLKLLPLVTLSLLVLVADPRPLRRQASEPSRAHLLLLSFGALVAYSVYVGGDAWEWAGFANRFIAPGLGLAVAAISVSLVRIFLAPSSRMKSWLQSLSSTALRNLMTLASSAALLAIVGGRTISEVVSRTPFDDIVARALGFGRNAGPSDWESWFDVTFRTPLLLVAGVAVVLLLAILTARERVPFIVVVSVLVSSATWSALPSVASWQNGVAGIGVSEDAEMVGFGIALREATAPEAVVAIVWAGNIAYYSDRSVIDLLGKSDSIIARLNPQISRWQDLYPGHNKWDYAYSVGVLRPDIVAQTYGLSDSDRKNFASWGYRTWCLSSRSVWIKDSSDSVLYEHFVASDSGTCL